MVFAVVHESTSPERPWIGLVSSPLGPCGVTNAGSKPGASGKLNEARANEARTVPKVFFPSALSLGNAPGRTNAIGP